MAACIYYNGHASGTVRIIVVLLAFCSSIRYCRCRSVYVSLISGPCLRSGFRFILSFLSSTSLFPFLFFPFLLSFSFPRPPSGFFGLSFSLAFLHIFSPSHRFLSLSFLYPPFHLFSHLPFFIFSFTRSLTFSQVPLLFHCTGPADFESSDGNGGHNSIKCRLHYYLRRPSLP